MKSTTEFPDSKSLTLNLKPDLDPTQIISDYNLRLGEIQDKETAIEKLRKKRTEAGTPHEAKKLTEQIKEWEKVGTFLGMADETILAAADGWDLIDAETNLPKPFNAEGLKGVSLNRRLLVVQQLIKDLGFDEREMTDPKALSDKSEPQSFSVNTAASNSQTG
jgi:hypothetical protein